MINGISENGLSMLAHKAKQLLANAQDWNKEVADARMKYKEALGDFHAQANRMYNSAGTELKKYAPEVRKDARKMLGTLIIPFSGLQKLSSGKISWEKKFEAMHAVTSIFAGFSKALYGQHPEHNPGNGVGWAKAQGILEDIQERASTAAGALREAKMEADKAENLVVKTTSNIFKTTEGMRSGQAHGYLQTLNESNRPSSVVRNQEYGEYLQMILGP